MLAACAPPHAEPLIALWRELGWQGVVIERVAMELTISGGTGIRLQVTNVTRILIRTDSEQQIRMGLSRARIWLAC